MRGLRRYVRIPVGPRSLGFLLSSGRGEQLRFQSSDKKFHCTICKKSFRLEMAAKLHIQQVHNGEGTIEAGAGPGVESVAPAVTSSPVGPPTAPIARDDLDGRRRERPTPRPLHQSNYEVPAGAMEAMLGVWDAVGTKRGIEGFIHSSMVLKVYAAKPSGPESTFTNTMAKPEGENPFAMYSKGCRRVWSDPLPTKQCPPSPFKIAVGSLMSPVNCGWIANPYSHKSLMPKREALKVAKQDEPTEAPVTPYGQLPKFGQAIASPSVPVPPSGSSPFAAAAQAASPFAAAAQAASPFAAAAQAASPFAAAAQAASPFAAAAQAASPFTAGQSGPAQTSPFVSAPSPFVNNGAASPFAQGDGSPFGAFGGSPFPSFPGFEAFGMMGTGAMSGTSTAPAEEKKFGCSVCGKAFHTEFGLADHSKKKHNIDMPLVIKDHKRKERVPDLPAYVPSPVDLAGTSPFGAEPTSAAQRWNDVELIPHALSVSNITIVGVVSELSSGPTQANVAESSFLTVRVESEDASDDSDEFVVQCSKSQLLSAGISRGSMVCVVGSFRLHPTLDEASNKYYSVPIVHLSESSGMLTAI